MRTKSILAAAAIIAAGAASSQAQSNVYSLNVVGYVNVTVGTGFTMVNNPLVPSNAQIGTMLDDGANGTTKVPAGSTVYSFKNGAYSINFSDEFGGGWSNPSETITNGQAFFFLNNSGSPTNITFVGEVPQGALTTALAPGFSLVGSKVPQAGFIADLGVNSFGGDIVYKFTDGSYKIYFNDEFGGGWSSSAVDFDAVKGPNLPVGAGMFYFRSDVVAPATWVRNFTVQ